MADAGKDVIKAAKNGDLRGLRALLAKNPAWIEARDKDGSTPLHCAVWKGQEGVVAFLLEAGADVNARNQNEHWGTTPLHAAAHGNQPAIAEMLIRHGADPRALDGEGRTPLDHTEFHQAKAVARVLSNQTAQSGNRSRAKEEP